MGMGSVSSASPLVAHADYRCRCLRCPLEEADLVIGAGSEESVRAAAFAWLALITLDGTVPVTRAQLRDDFHVNGERFPLVDAGRGIRRPRGWSSTLSILTAAPEGAAWRP